MPSLLSTVCVRGIFPVQLLAFLYFLELWDQPELLRVLQPNLGHCCLGDECPTKDNASLRAVTCSPTFPASPSPGWI